MENSRWVAPRLVTCTCGRSHDSAEGMPEVWLGRGNLAQIRDVVVRHINGPVCLIADSATAGIAAQVKAHLGRLVAAEHIDSGTLEARSANVDKAMAAGASAGGFVSVGSGSITDVTRLAAFRLGKPQVAVATAASMDGYLSGHSPIVVDGYKITCPAVPPRAIVADLAVLEAAPVRLTRAGLGDVVGKFTALADWRLAHIMTGEYWCAGISDSVHAALGECRDMAPRLAGGDGSPAAAIIEALFVTGHAMVCAGNSRPASGAEHHIAHYWEMQALAKGMTPHLHGEHVAVACVLVAAVYRHLLAQEQLVASASGWAARLAQLTDRAARQSRLADGYGAIAARVEAETKDKDSRTFAGLAFQTVQQRWSTARQVLAGTVPPPQALVQILHDAGMAATPRELGLSAADARRGVMYARELRPRFTILDAAAMAGRLEELADRVTAEYM